MTDITSALEYYTIQLLMKKEYYLKYDSKVNDSFFAREFVALHHVIQTWHGTVEGDLNTKLLFEAVFHGSMATEANRSVIKRWLDKVDSLPPLSEEAIVRLLKSYIEKEKAQLILNIANKVFQRDDTATLSDILPVLEGIDTPEEDDEACNTSVESLQADLQNEKEFTFGNGLEAITDVFKLGFRRGHTMVVFAPVNAGKTHFCSQMAVGILKQGKKVLYLANEQDPAVLLQYFYRSYFGTNDYTKCTTTPPEFANLKIVSIADASLKEVETLLRKYRPDMVVVDQTDQLAARNNKTLRESLSAVYTRTRQLALIHKCLWVNVTQADATATKDGHGQPKCNPELRMSQMAESKIDKPANVDLVLGIGLVDFGGEARCIYISKNKCSDSTAERREGSLYFTFNGKTCRFERNEAGQNKDVYL